MHQVITVDSRFNGPPGMGHGGYVCGLIAGAVRRTVNVRVHKPVPLDTPLTIESETHDAWRVSANGQIIATAAPTEVKIAAPHAPAYVEALAAARHFRGFKHHFLPTCFGCGTERGQGDGLRIFPGPIPGRAMVAGPWLPDVSLVDADGKVRPEYMWAALDCPGYFASFPPEKFAVLGELAVHIDRRVPADERCVVVGWPVSNQGRRHRVGTALYSEEADVCAVGLATWIEVEPGAGGSAP